MKAIENYEGRYSVDRDGNIWSIKRNAVLKPRIRKNGYAYVCLCKDGVAKDFIVHRLVAGAYLGDIENMDVNHINGNRADNNVANLEIVSRSTNLLHGMHVLRTKNAKLTHDQVGQVKRMVASGMTQTDVAKKFGVLKQTVNQIINGKGYINSAIVNEYQVGHNS